MPKGIYKRTEYHMSLSIKNLGKRIFKGNIPWNKGKKGVWLNDNFLKLNAIQKDEKHDHA